MAEYLKISTMSLKKMISSRLFRKFAYSGIMNYLTILSLASCILASFLKIIRFLIKDYTGFGFKSRGNMTLEQVGLNQLIDRNLVSFEVKVWTKKRLLGP